MSNFIAITIVIGVRHENHEVGLHKWANECASTKPEPGKRERSTPASKTRALPITNRDFADGTCLKRKGTEGLPIRRITIVRNHQRIH